jgi:hypothetical protein
VVQTPEYPRSCWSKLAMPGGVREKAENLDRRGRVYVIIFLKSENAPPRMLVACGSETSRRPICRGRPGGSLLVGMF